MSILLYIDNNQIAEIVILKKSKPRLVTWTYRTYTVVLCPLSMFSNVPRHLPNVPKLVIVIFFLPKMYCVQIFLGSYFAYIFFQGQIWSTVKENESFSWLFIPKIYFTMSNFLSWPKICEKKTQKRPKLVAKPNMFKK